MLLRPLLLLELERKTALTRRNLPLPRLNELLSGSLGPLYIFIEQNVSLCHRGFPNRAKYIDSTACSRIFYFNKGLDSLGFLCSGIKYGILLKVDLRFKGTFHLCI
jgi:hypothetical protein